uniref:CNMamide, isoform D n=1 Tax=Drosophila melanogaster TaxID=7227 RepID=M9PE91_DROME|nr:CNMamide, isoform D [Drosophila melanogaster]AGB93989.1 CNMamide, isoform D [Drosophila melanogaster]|eukprot:NP_001261294.1 CNMamide, isoform D [Drosophila melanogaster]
MSALSAPTTCGCSPVHWAIVIVLLSVAIGPGDAMARPARNTQLLFSELLGGGNDDNNYYGDQLKYQQQQQQQQEQKQQRVPAFARKWPSLRDLLLTVDYDDFGVTQESEEQVAPSSRLLARLHRLGDNGGGEELRYNVVNELTNMPSKKVMPGHPLKDHNTKKNVQYMSPCHFKICNMGRKRNAGFNSY